MKRLERIWTILLTMVLALSICVPVFAAVEDTGFSDVDADAWYAEAVKWCKDNSIMNGTSDINATFSPDDTLTRAMVATVLYRAEGEPAVSTVPSFTDTQAGVWYSNAVVWADAEGLMQGYGDGLFGTNDLVTREQLATILWRYDGEKDAEPVSLPDASSVSEYACTAVSWAVDKGVLTLRDDGSVAPGEAAVRAEVAVALMACLKDTDLPAQPEPDEGGKVLVAYFSATGNTEGVAEKIAASLDNADLYEIVPAQPYTAADLDYNTDCRANREQNDNSARPAISGTVANIDDYDVIFLGFPIWWGRSPKIIYTFLESYDFNGKTVIPFCTSGSSGYNDSGIKDLVGGGTNWVTGQRFSGSASESAVKAWVDGLDLAK